MERRGGSASVVAPWGVRRGVRGRGERFRAPRVPRRPARACLGSRAGGRASGASVAPRPSIHFFRRRRGGAAAGEARRARGRRGGGAGNGGETHPRRAESAVGRTEAAEAEMQAIVVDARRGAVCAMARAGTRGVAPRGADVDVARRGSRFGKYSRDWIATQTHILFQKRVTTDACMPDQARSLPKDRMDASS